MRRTARLSRCGTYRYALTRTWKPTTIGQVCFVMLNPSTADASIDDPTIRRCKGLADSWGYGSLVVVNLFAFRATKPADLLKRPTPVMIGPGNDDEIIRHTLGRKVVLAWGCIDDARVTERADEVFKILSWHDRKMYYLKLSPRGRPWHPLFVPKDCPMTPWLEK